MNPFLAYLLKSSISLALLYVVFKLSLSRDKMHTANRFVLIGILLTSVILPFADIPVFSETQVIPQFEVIHEFVRAPQITAAPIHNESIEATNEVSSFSVNPWLLFYLSVIGLLVIRLAFSVARVLQIIRRAEKQNFRDVILAIVKDFIQPFSFLQHIILSEKDFTENKDIILAHEYAHIQHKHAVDLMICELFTALYWFNPFMWLLRRDLKLIHEYQADQAVLNKGIDAKTYQLLVLKKAVGERRFALANNFTQKPILKRIKMMHMKNNRRRTSLKLVLFVPVVALLLQAFARPEMIPDKISDLVPSLSVQKDSSEVWLDNWSIQNLSKINAGLEMTEFEVAPPPPGSKPLGLPKYDKTKHGDPIPSENIMTILVNRKSKILACGSFATIDEVQDGVTKFLNENPPFDQMKKGPETISKNLPLVGDVKISKGVIVLRYDVETDKTFVDKMLRSIGKIYLEKRQELAQAEFKQDYFSLSAEKKQVINQMLPVRISIMEPKNIKGTSETASPPPPLEPLNIKIDKTGEMFYGKYTSSKTGNVKRLTAWSKKVTKEELKDLLQKRNEYSTRMTQKYNRTYSTVVNFMVEDGVPNSRVNELKELLRDLKIQNINYSSENSSENVKQGSSTGDLNQFDQYAVIITSDKLQAFNKVCTVENVKQEVEEYLKSKEKKESISVLSFSDVPKERLESVINELNQIPFRKISTTVLKPEQQPVSTAQHKILLKADGSICMDEERYNLKEFESRINEIRSQSGETNVALEVENDVTYLQIETVKRILRAEKVDIVGYSIQRHSVRETTPGTKIGEESHMFGFGWSGNGLPDLDKLRREAEAFLSKKGNYSLYTQISPDKNATQQEIDVVKKVLLDAGFLKVEIRESRN